MTASRRTCSRRTRPSSPPSPPATSPSPGPRTRTFAARSPRSIRRGGGSGPSSAAGSALPNECSARADDEPGAAELGDVLAQDLADLVRVVVVERPAVVRDLATAVAPLRRADERPLHALAGEEPPAGEVDGPLLGARAVAPAE